MALYSNEDLFKSTLELELVPKPALEAALKHAQEQKVSLGELLVDENLLTDAEVGQLIADLIHKPFIRLAALVIPFETLHLIPQHLAQKCHFIAFKLDSAGLHLAFSQPLNPSVLELLVKKMGVPLIEYYATDRDIDDALNHYTSEITQVIRSLLGASSGKTTSTEELPIVGIVDAIIRFGYQNHASDIHLEHSEGFSLVRFRVDGMLHDIIKLPVSLHPPIVNRIKVLAKLRTDEHQAAQDGKIHIKIDDESLDIRVSIVPLTEGEKVVMRLFAQHANQLTLLDLGLLASDLQKIQAAAKRPYGMILATGPTGSGKTTSLYSIIHLINHRDINIMTIEDPVEYQIEGINQIQVNAKTNLTFASGLRSIVRQDPNVILVGEIRDEETADIAVNAAMTGHLVLSTLHTNDASTSIPRLLDMGVEPFLVASTVNVVIAQRLARKICLKCRVSTEITLSDLTSHFSPALLQKIFKTKKVTRVYKGKGCPLCFQTGYKGRLGIFEVMEVTPKLREAITSRQDASQIRQLAITEGMTTMVEDGLTKVAQGLITIDEVLRVSKED